MRGPLQLELRNGCQDSVVVGGLERLVETVGAPFADVRAVIEGYGDLDAEQRESRLERALRLLDENPLFKQPTNKAAPAPATPPPRESEAPQSVRPGSGESFGSDVLDTLLEDRAIDLGAQAPKKLAAIGVRTYRDLLHHYPKRYEDRRALPYFASLQNQDAATVVGTVTGRKATKSKRGMVVLRAFLEDGLGARLTVTWFNQPWLEKQLFPGQRLIVTGKVKRKGSLVEISASHHEIDDDNESLSAGRIVGVYGSTQGLSQAYVRRAAHRLLSALETLPTICREACWSASTSCH